MPTAAEAPSVAEARTPDVSVVLPTHDRLELLRRSVDSVLRQDGVDLELVVVDDGSTDGTAAYLAALPDARVAVVRHDAARGVSAARNAGIERARGPVIAFLDDDDLWAPDKLRVQLDAMRDTGRAWAYAGAVHINTAGRISGGTAPMTAERFAATLPRWNPMPAGCSNAIVEAGALGLASGFDEDLQILADWDLWLRLNRIGPPAAVARPLVAYRVHDSNMSLETDLLVRELEILRRRYGEEIDRTRMLEYAARLAMRAGRWGEATRLTIRAGIVAPRGRPRRIGSGLAMLGVATSRAARGRFLPASARARERSHRRAAAADPNVAWKAEAEAWLAPLLERPLP
jgi:glycosyltransferase involved in cell wall biosynthesis